MSNIFLTGRPGAGKTTAIRKLMAGLPKIAGGFYTEEIRQGGARQGFKIRSLDGQEGVLAHVKCRSKHRVGKYGVNVAAFEEVGVKAVEDALEREGVIVMDELGKMELYSEKFREVVIRALDSPLPVLGTIQDRKTPFLDSIRARADTQVFRLTPESRETVVVEVAAAMRESL